MSSEQVNDALTLERLREIERRVEWCEAWLARQRVRHPRITNEWRNLLADARVLVEAVTLAFVQHDPESERLIGGIEAALEDLREIAGKPATSPEPE